MAKVRFSLRNAVILLTIVSALLVPLMLKLHSERSKALAVKGLRESGVRIWFRPQQGLAAFSPQIELVSIVEFEGNVEQLAPLTLLQIPHLAFVNAPVSSELVDILVRVDGLSKLNLSDTNVGDDSLRRLAEVRSLTYVNVMGSKVTPDGVRGFHRLRPDCILSVAPDNTFMQWLSRLFDS